MKTFKTILCIFLIISTLMACSSCGYKIVKIDNQNTNNTSSSDSTITNNQNNNQNKNDTKIPEKNEERPIYLTTSNFNDYFTIENKTTAREDETENYDGTEWVDVTATFKIIPKKEEYIFLNSFILIRIVFYEKNIDTTLKIEIDKYGYGIGSITLTPDEPYKNFESIKPHYQIYSTAGTIEKNTIPERIDENKYILIGNNNYSEYLDLDWSCGLIEWDTSLFGSGYKKFTITQKVSGIYGNYEYKDVYLQIKVQITTTVTQKKLFNDKKRSENYPIWVYDLETSAGARFERTYSYFATDENNEFLLSTSDIQFNICKVNVVSGYMIRK